MSTPNENEMPSIEGELEKAKPRGKRKAMTTEQVMHTLYPGRVVELDAGATVKVYPLGFVHMRRFTNQISAALAVMARNTPKDMATDPARRSELGKQLMAQLAPYLLNNLMELVEECCEVDPKEIGFEELAHWDIAKVVEAWVMENFGEEKKWKPWVEALDRLMVNFTGAGLSNLTQQSSN